ncbi:MAG: hypothetical protein CMJ19_13335 [Phycisphaeraceae bacterium]|nr:hypothetical protein [Phycisphaeraceae bacterium]
MTDTTAKGKPRPALFRALGKNEPPTEITADGQRYVQVKILKHDSWAATGLYAGDDEAGNPGAGQKIIAKFNRQQSIFGFPMKWLGLILASGEHTIMKAMADEPTIAHSFDVIEVEGKQVHHVAAHKYIDGHPLTPNDRVTDEFFPTLKAVLEKLHSRGIAYVDMNKAENVIVGDDGLPHLIDYQISFMLPKWWPGNWFGTRVLLWVLQQSDMYHLMKHWIRYRPDQLPEDQRDINKHRPIWIRGWRCLATPFRETRRRLLVLVGIRKGKGKSVTEHAPEDAVQRQMNQTNTSENTSA